LVSGQEVFLAYIQDLIIKPPFSELFSIDENVLQAIVKNILENTYDESQPIVVWKDQNIVIDGHTRLKASHLAGRQIISVFNKAFRNEEEALQYAINNQRNRRNMSEAELLRCIEAVDKRQERGGDRKSEEAKSKAPSGGIEKSKSPSAQETARIVGASARKVERARSVLSDPEEKEAVITGKKSINKASQDAKAKKSQDQRRDERGRSVAANDAPGKTTVEAKGKMAANEETAWAELMAWRAKYAECKGLNEIFSIIDRAQTDAVR
jgi:ParB family chromosome partitioning protein